MSVVAQQWFPGRPFQKIPALESEVQENVCIRFKKLRRHSLVCSLPKKAMVANEFGSEFRVAGRLGTIIYGLPRSVHRRAAQRFPDAYQRILHRYCEMLQGKETHQSLWNRILQRPHWPFCSEMQALGDKRS